MRLREESGLTQEQVAEDLEWSPSKLTRVEGGRGSITKVDLCTLQAYYSSVPKSRREQSQVLSRSAYERVRRATSRAEMGYETRLASVRHSSNSISSHLPRRVEYAEAFVASPVDPHNFAPPVRLRT